MEISALTQQVVNIEPGMVFNVTKSNRGFLETAQHYMV